MSNDMNPGKRNIMLQLMYDGSDYNGWQRLTNGKQNKKSIQGLLEETLSNILKEKVRVIGSGRTDAGVHALDQVCNFHTKSCLDSRTIRQELNELLPFDIRVTHCDVVNDRFHSRYSATRKIYEYRIDTKERESVFQRKYTYPANKKLDIDAMNQAAQYLIGEHDFKAYSTKRNDNKSTVRTIYRLQASLYQLKDRAEEVRIECEGNGFLYHMVRIIAGTLYEVGAKERSIESVREALLTGQRKNAGILLYPQGLFLKQVIYNNNF